MTLSTGQLLAERYRLGRRIAVGGMGEVWEAADTRLDRQVAVKVLKQELSGDDEFRHRFRAEARTTASLNHPGIAGVHDYGETSEQTAYLVMELVAGEPLATVLTRQRRLSAEHTLDVLEQAGNALQAAHERGLVHRDVKPGNILLTPNGTVKITDFGIARAVDAAPLTRAGIVLGTAHYIAPEQAAGSEAGPASDVYSLGVVGYECLAGHRPFQADSAVTVAMMHIRDAPPPLPPDVPLGVRSLIEATLVKDPRQRYVTGGEFAHAVGAVRAGHRLPVPAGMAGAAATTLLAGDYPATQVHPAPPPRTALLPPGALTGPRRASPTPYPPSRQSGPRRRGGGWMIAVLLVAALALVALGLRELRGAGGTEPGATGLPAPTAGVPAPAQEPDPGDIPQLEPEQPAEDGPEAVSVEIQDYVGRSGAEASERLAEDGLQPLVVDPDGAELDATDQEDCVVLAVEPTGSVEPGSVVTVTCLRIPS
ncbi:MAG: protein kinase [Actinomycetota bacterium]|nr:protein kinase [Actinomycetota bacterium]